MPPRTPPPGFCTAVMHVKAMPAATSGGTSAWAKLAAAPASKPMVQKQFVMFRPNALQPQGSTHLHARKPRAMQWQTDASARAAGSARVHGSRACRPLACMRWSSQVCFIARRKLRAVSKCRARASSPLHALAHASSHRCTAAGPACNVSCVTTPPWSSDARHCPFCQQEHTTQRSRLFVFVFKNRLPS